MTLDFHTSVHNRRQERNGETENKSQKHREALCATEGEYIQFHAVLVGLGIQPSENFPLPVGFLPAFSSTQRPADHFCKSQPL
jgi:hypothetical protein